MIALTGLKVFITAAALYIDLIIIGNAKHSLIPFVCVLSDIFLLKFSIRLRRFPVCHDQ